MDKRNLPIKVGEKSIADITKKVGYKTTKILGGTAATLGMASLFGLCLSTMPVLAIPTFIGSVYSAQYLLNNTIYKSYKDLSFITGKNNGNVKIYQDITRIDMIKRILSLNNIEKAAFMQLNIIAGMSRVNNVDKKGNEIVYETDTHKINRKTFRKLEELGYLKDYEENLLKKSRIILPKLAFGNFKGIKEKVDIYNIKFKLTGKKIDVNDPKLIKSFPTIFGRKGIMINKGYNFIQEPDGSLSIDYKPKEPYNKKSYKVSKREEFCNELKDKVPTLEEQQKYTQEILYNQSNRKIDEREDVNIK